VALNRSSGPLPARSTENQSLGWDKASHEDRRSSLRGYQIETRSQALLTQCGCATLRLPEPNSLNKAIIYHIAVSVFC